MDLSSMISSKDGTKYLDDLPRSVVSYDHCVSNMEIGLIPALLTQGPTEILVASPSISSGQISSVIPLSALQCSTMSNLSSKDKDQILEDSTPFSIKPTDSTIVNVVGVELNKNSKGKGKIKEESLSTGFSSKACPVTTAISGGKRSKANEDNPYAKKYKK
ncbi:uncharacterized protein LOC133805382 [Humulus lupulus]|uniref:uncharacterized protein LOC133805382 n=1 Tax=Humulus lupulus TaxID=3486 RepID=UPI002B402D15|nr:uncharacterized protein LOC133805382 [Humulus lupulus]